MSRRARYAWAAAGGLGVAVAVTWAGLPDAAPLARSNPATTAFIARYQATRRPLAWQPVPLGQVAPALWLAVLVSEDIGFFAHHGFEVAEMRSAVRDAVRRRSAPRGASTITQQLAKNLWLSPSRNPLRKLKEAMLTRRLERSLTKERILELYLNVAEFGVGIYGAEAAALAYFAKPAAALTAHEAALLAASLPRPATWHPGTSSSAYLLQVERIEGRMARAQNLRLRFGLPPADTTGLPPDTLPLWDALIPPESLLVPDSLPELPDTTQPILSDTGPTAPDTIPVRPGPIP